jgi:hypothetical protein
VIITRTVTVVDLTPPVVVLIGASSIVVSAGNTFTDPGATWTDNVDGTGTILVATSGTVNVGVP